MAATVACNFTGSTTVGFSGHLIKITAGLPVGWMRMTAKRSALVTGPEANSIGDDVVTAGLHPVEGPFRRMRLLAGPPKSLGETE
jgi:hypothetical protein